MLMYVIALVAEHFHLTAPTVETVTSNHSYRVTLGRHTLRVSLTDRPNVYLVNDAHTVDLSGSIPLIDGRRDHTGRCAMHVDACNYVDRARSLAKEDRTQHRSCRLAKDELPQNRTRTRSMPETSTRGPVRMRPLPDMLKIRYHPCLCRTATRQGDGRGGADLLCRGARQSP